jgi:hypothetical protein
MGRATSGTGWLVYYRARALIRAAHDGGICRITRKWSRRRRRRAAAHFQALGGQSEGRVTVNRLERVGEHFQWHAATDEVEDLRDHTRRRASEYSAKVDVYEDRVRHWFLGVAQRLIANGPDPADYVALAVAVAYLEGVEQYRRGSVAPAGQRGQWFQDGAARVFAGTDGATLARLWRAVRCGLFHSGFTEGPILLSHNEPTALRAAPDGFLHINPVRFVERRRLRQLRCDPSIRCEQ